jgi:hypothetical protein
MAEKKPVVPVPWVGTTVALGLGSIAGGIMESLGHGRSCTDDLFIHSGLIMLILARILWVVEHQDRE